MHFQRANAAKPMIQKAVRLEREGDLAAAFEAYAEAAAIAPHDPELLLALARLAGALGMHDHAVQMWERLTLADPTGGCEAVLGQANALIAAARLGEAVALLRGELLMRADQPRLWAMLGLALTYAGRADEALTFCDEAVRLAPKLSEALYNRALAYCDLDRAAEAEADMRAAAKAARSAPERATIEFSLATLLLGRGELPAGWAAYEKRLSSDWHRSVTFQSSGKRLAEVPRLAGRSVLVLAEQGLGDELMFAGTLPDLLAEVGETGRVVLAVDPRLVDLVQRSFPAAEVVAHATPRIGARPRRQTRSPVAGRIDAWSPLASLSLRYRRSFADFPRAPYLVPDPARVEHWRAWLGETPAVGLTWRRAKHTGESLRRIPRLEDWTDLLRTPGVQFVNLQYGECADDLATFAQQSGVEIRQPPGLDLKDHIDDLAALCAALDAVVGIQNATTMLSAACGAPTVFVTGPGSWFQLGEADAPWFAHAPVFATDSYADWTPALGAAAEAMRKLVLG